MEEHIKIDLSIIGFPSDRLTIKVLREHHPTQVDTGEFVTLFSATASNNAADWVGGMLSLERMLAAAAFNEILGGNPHKLLTREELKEYASDLSDVYIIYGIADGPTTAKELIRGIESQAEAQARQHLPSRS